MTLEEALESKTKTQKDTKLLKDTLPYLKPSLHLFLGGILLDLFVVLSFAAEPLIVGQVVRGIDNQDFMRAIITAFIALALFTTGVVAIYFSNIFIQRTGVNIIYAIRHDVFAHIEGLSINQLNSLPVGKLVTRVTTDTLKISNLFTMVFMTLLRSFTSLLVVTIIVMLLNWKVGLILLAFVPIVGAVVFFFRNLSRKSYRKTRTAVSNINGFLAENLSGMLTTQVFNQQKRKNDEFSKLNDEVYNCKMREVKLFAFFRPTFSFIYSIALICVVGFAIVLVSNSYTLEPDLVTSLYLYTSQFFGPIQNAAEQFNNLQESLSSIERVSIIMQVEAEVYDHADAISTDHFEGKIEFKNVWFAYIEDEWILKDVSFVINKGDTAAFVGATGAGKSTIISLITRNYECQKGEILIDDIPVEKYELNTLRRHIGEMLQTVFLFAGTVAENITMFDETISRERIEEAARYVGADDFIRKLPNGYDEMVYERGNNFSMGQRQLISFARVALYNPNIILLDEATANIDTETEVLIQDSLEKMKNIGTMVIVAHRLSTIKNADKIFLLSQGQIVEEGNHQELLKKHGRYYKLYQLQNMEKNNESGQN